MNLVGISNKKTLHVPYRDSKLTFLLQVDIFVELGFGIESPVILIFYIRRTILIKRLI